MFTAVCQCPSEMPSAAAVFVYVLITVLISFVRWQQIDVFACFIFEYLFPDHISAEMQPPDL